jgi:hypothetical protein
VEWLLALALKPSELGNLDLHPILVTIMGSHATLNFPDALNIGPFINEDLKNSLNVVANRQTETIKKYGIAGRIWC